MPSDEQQQRLSRIATQWTMLLEAHRSNAGAAQPARAELAQRYVGAVYRYLLAIVRDVDLAEELCQQFALKFLDGEFHNVRPDRGRFRDYVKTVIVNLVRSHHRKKGKDPVRLPEQVAAEQGDSSGDSTQTFVREWQKEVLEQTWRALQRERPNYYHVLKLRVENPDLTSRELAERYSEEQTQPMTPANVRKILERGHTKFAQLLVEEVAASLDNPDAASLRSELEELDLLKYCRTAFDDWSDRQGHD